MFTYLALVCNPVKQVSIEYNYVVAGNLVFDPNQSARKIVIPIIAHPSDGLATFSVQLTEVRGTGKLSGCTTTNVALEPVARKII